jgi:hypothetical protein
MRITFLRGFGDFLRRSWIGWDEAGIAAVHFLDLGVDDA